MAHFLFELIRSYLDFVSNFAQAFGDFDGTVAGLLIAAPIILVTYAFSALLRHRKNKRWKQKYDDEMRTFWKAYKFHKPLPDVPSLKKDTGSFTLIQLDPAAVMAKEQRENGTFHNHIDEEIRNNVAR